MQCFRLSIGILHSIRWKSSGILVKLSLSPAQKKYTATEKKLLAIVLTLKKYRRMILGGRLGIYTGHKKFTFRNLSTQRVLQLYLDQYDFELKYLEGKKIVIVDYFSRLPRMDKS